MIQITNKVPLPKRPRTKWSDVGEMKPGDSFFMAGVTSRMAGSYAQSWKKQYGFTFTTAKTREPIDEHSDELVDGIRIWRKT